MSATPSNLDLLSNVLPEISKFLDVESTVHLSRTCRTTHGYLVHNELHQNNWYPKLKVPYFSMGDPILWRDENWGRISSSMFPSKTLSPHVLTTIHFPSLKRLEFRLVKHNGVTFPMTNKNIMEFSMEFSNSFSYMAIHIENATELEELVIDIALFIRDEKSHAPFYKHFANNLAKCTKLKRLTIFNDENIQRRSCYSLGLLLALAPAIERLSSTLEAVTIMIGDLPIGGAIAPAWVERTRDMFKSMLMLPKLKEFNLHLNLATSPLLNILLEAAQIVHQTVGTLPSTSLEKFMLTSLFYSTRDGAPNPLPAPHSLAPCLALLRNCPELFAFIIRLPSGCWDAKGLVEVGHIVTNNVNIRHLGLYFHGYECGTGKSLGPMLNYIRAHENYSNNVLRISGISRFDGEPFDEEESLERYHSMDGQQCLTYDSKGRLKFVADGSIIKW